MMMHGGGSNKCKGLILVVFGILFLLGTLGVWPDYTFAKYWPVPVIVFGLHDLLCPCHGRGMKKGECCDGEMDMKDGCCGGGCGGCEPDKSNKKR